MSRRDYRRGGLFPKQGTLHRIDDYFGMGLTEEKDAAREGKSGPTLCKRKPKRVGHQKLFVWKVVPPANKVRTTKELRLTSAIVGISYSATLCSVRKMIGTDERRRLSTTKL